MDSPVGAEHPGLKHLGRWLTVITVVALVIVLGLAWAAFQTARGATQDQIVTDTARRVAALRETIAHSRSLVLAMAENMARNIELAESGAALAPALSGLGPVDSDTGDRFTIDATATADARQAPHDSVATLSGRGTTGTVVGRRRAEVTAALALNPIIVTALREVQDVVWVYYTSVDGFIALAPGPPASEWHFAEDLYTTPFWTEAIPQNNPDRGIVLSEVYDDTGGEGLMISFSAPVHVADRFRGVASLDIGIAALRESVDASSTIGDSILMDEAGKLAAQTADFEPPVLPEVPAGLFGDGRREVADASMTWWSHPVTASELWMVHKASNTDVLVAAAWRAAPQWAMLIGLFLMLRLLFRLQSAHARLRESSQRDPLTNALNRRAFEERAEPAISLARRNGKPSSVMMIDADRFKRINDEHGHAVGDEVLVALSESATAQLRTEDVFGRYGGEEFIVLSPMASASDVTTLAERVRSAIERQAMSSSNLVVTVSIGCAEMQEDEGLHDALKRADEALYQAKDSGRNRVVVADDIDRSATPVVKAAGSATS